jgi:hypothetical protein
MPEPIKRLPKISDATEGGTWKPLLGIVVIAVVGAATTVALLRLLPLLMR